MCTYHNVAKVVEPKIASLRAAEAELKVATKEKNAAEDRMAKVRRERGCAGKGRVGKVHRSTWTGVRRWNVHERE